MFIKIFQTIYDYWLFSLFQNLQLVVASANDKCHHVFEHCGIPLFLVQESRDVFVVFTDIILSHDDVFDSNVKIFW